MYESSVFLFRAKTCCPASGNLLNAPQLGVCWIMTDCMSYMRYILLHTFKKKTYTVVIMQCGGDDSAAQRIYAIEVKSLGLQAQKSGCMPCRAKEPVVTPLDTIDCIYSRADNTILVSSVPCENIWTIFESF